MGTITGVAPLAGAWIEIGKTVSMSLSFVSLPLRERGLKFLCHFSTSHILLVAPLAGAWIEISAFPGDWYALPQSLPLRERGLKFPALMLWMALCSRSPCGSVD